MRSAIFTLLVILALTVTSSEAATLDIDDVISSTGASYDGMLSVEINKTTGGLSIRNTSGSTLSFGAYSIFSTAAGGNLNPGVNIANSNPQSLFSGDGLNSIQQQAAADFATVVATLGAQALAFEVVSATSEEISEISGTATLQPGASWSFGNPLIPGTQNDSTNFAFVYAWMNPSSGLEVLYSDVVATPEPATIGLMVAGAVGLVVRKRHLR
ncbi:MAG: PEP-CTERM sorting domain-containing protein [bacterium]|nr:PEP-CTERM sorting domain-containing protein [bacterium]